MEFTQGDDRFGVIVVGGGHAGCEAVLACARRGVRTLLITANIDRIAAMSCNPSIGGLGKGHIVKEIDALGGEMGKNIDETGIHFKKLNTKKGTAVQGTRAQADKYLYMKRMQQVIDACPNISIREGVVKKVIVENSSARGVELISGFKFFADAIIITTGTFLNGLCHTGLKSTPGGRTGEVSARDLSLSLANDCGLELMRLKTGTVPRIDKRTIDFSSLEEQRGDFPLPLFSFSETQIRQKQVSCYITHTNERTHEIIRSDLSQSPLYQGIIKGKGPRYCPSIEDKIIRFADKERHQIFLEPEGLTSGEIYPNGISTSLPIETQIKFVRSIRGCEMAEITRPGYAVEYDAANPLQIKSNYETKNITGLFLAGQINGTTGYEEAAAQGLMAAVNAVNYIRGDDPLILGRHQAYIGVMTNDLVTKGVGGEPYRMFTSRAEYRLVLREDNAEARLRKIGFDLGLVSEEDFFLSEKRKARQEKTLLILSKKRISATDEDIKNVLLENGIPFQHGTPINNILLRPEIEDQTATKIIQILLGRESPPAHNEISSCMSELRYSGYIKKFEEKMNHMRFYINKKIPQNICYDHLKSLSSEVREKLAHTRPENLDQALRIPGVTPAAIEQLEVFLSRRTNT